MNPCAPRAGGDMIGFGGLRVGLGAGRGLGIGLVLGAAGGVALARRRGSRRRMPAAAQWQERLALERGDMAAALLLRRVEERYRELHASRPALPRRALAMHLELNLLPGLAMYQVLREDGLAPGEARDEVTRLLAHARVGSLRAPLLGRPGPGAFTIFRWATRVVMRTVYPVEGWSVEWVEDSPRRIAFNLHSCFYVDVLRDYGAPELTPAFCALDDAIYEGLPYVRWERTQTIGSGAPYCDFAWSNPAAAGGRGGDAHA